MITAGPGGIHDIHSPPQRVRRRLLMARSTCGAAY